MKRQLILVLVVVLLSCLVLPCQADLYFFDDFDDGNADGWWLGYSHHAGPSSTPHWSVEDGYLVQRYGGDGVIGLVENLLFSSQSIETQFKNFEVAGYGGVIIWFQDYNKWTEVCMYPKGHIYVTVNVDGHGTSFDYPYASLENTWYNLRVDADSINGELAVYVNDTYLFTYTASTPYRTGQSGVFSGNSGAYFDNFRITPLPSAVILGSIGLTFSGWLLKRRKML